MTADCAEWLDSLNRPNPLDAEEEPAAPKFRFLPVAELLAGDPPLWRVVNTLPAEGVGVIWGGPGSGKTYAALDLGLAIARGIYWHGHRTRRGGVAYVACEGSLRDRVDAYLKHNALSADQLSLFRVLPSSINLLVHRDGSDLPELINALERAQAEMGALNVVVIDTLNRAMPGGNENASENMGGPVRAAQAIAQRFRCLVLFIHHSGKVEAAGARGHSSLKGAVDVELAVTRTEAVRTLSVVKLRDGEDNRDVLSFVLCPIDLGAVADYDPEADEDERRTACIVDPVALDPAATKRGPLTKAQKAVLQCMHDLMTRDKRLPPRDCLQHPRPPKPGQIACPIETLREGVLSTGGISDSDNRDSQRKAFNRALNSLRDSAVIDIFADWTWLRDNRDTSGTG